MPHTYYRKTRNFNAFEFDILVVDLRGFTAMIVLGCMDLIK